MEHTSKGAQLLRKHTAPALEQQGAKWTPETGWTEQAEERIVITGEKHGGGSFTEYCYKATARKNAKFYRGRGFKVITWTIGEYREHLESLEP